MTAYTSIFYAVALNQVLQKNLFLLRRYFSLSGINKLAVTAVLYIFIANS